MKCFLCARDFVHFFPRFLSFSIIKDDAAKAIANESVELEEGKFDKLQKKLGRINPETLGDVMDGKIKLNPAEKKEFDEFMKGVRKMFASTNY